MPTSVPDPDDHDQLAGLEKFRDEVHQCFAKWADTLFETVDALLCGPTRLDSLPHLSLQPELRRGHGSLYAAPAKGDIDTDALGRVLAGAIQPDFGLVFAPDASNWHRPDAETSPDRTLNYDSRKDNGTTGGRVDPTTPGWAFQWLTQIGPTRTSWVTPVDVERVGPDTDSNLLAVRQIRRLLEHLAAPGVVGVPIVRPGQRADRGPRPVVPGLPPDSRRRGAQVAAPIGSGFSR